MQKVKSAPRVATSPESPTLDTINIDNIKNVSLTHQEAMNSNAKAKGKAVLENNDEQDDLENGWFPTKILLENHASFKKTGAPIQFMFYSAGSWLEFPAEVVNRLRAGFDQGMPMIEVEIAGVRFLFDLYRMVQVDLESGESRSISWADTNGKYFFPETSIDEFGRLEESDSNFNPTAEVLKISSKNHKIGIKIRIASDPPYEPSRMLPRWSHTRLVEVGESTYETVEAYFMSGLGLDEANVKITSIHQGLGSDPMVKARTRVFYEKLEEMKVGRGGEAKVTFGWHGTSVEGVNRIMVGYGFEASRDLGCDHAHGVGVYLSPLRSPHMSSLLAKVDDHGEKHLVLCRILLGRCEQIAAGSKQQHPSSRNFDSGVDNHQNPTWYIMWCDYMNTRLLPEYVVSYKHRS